MVKGPSENVGEAVRKARDVIAQTEDRVRKLALDVKRNQEPVLEREELARTVGDSDEAERNRTKADPDRRADPREEELRRNALKTLKEGYPA